MQSNAAQGRATIAFVPATDRQAELGRTVELRRQHLADFARKTRHNVHRSGVSTRQLTWRKWRRNQHQRLAAFVRAASWRRA